MLRESLPEVAPALHRAAMVKRARQSSYWLTDPLVPRVREIREARGLSEAQLAAVIFEKTGKRFSASQIHRVEVGPTRLTPDKAQLIAAGLDVATSDLFSEMPLTVPLLYRVGLRRGEEPAVFDPPTVRRSVPHHLARAITCVAADVIDDSADRLGYPRGSTLFVRPMAGIDGLAFGSQVLVAVFAGDAANGVATEILAGEFQQTVMGDMLVSTRSSNRAVPAAIRLREGARAPGVEEASVPYQPGKVSYAPRPGDEALLLGRVEAATIPVIPRPV